MDRDHRVPASMDMESVNALICELINYPHRSGITHPIPTEPQSRRYRHSGWFRYALQRCTGPMHLYRQNRFDIHTQGRIADSEVMTRS